MSESNPPRRKLRDLLILGVVVVIVLAVVGGVAFYLDEVGAFMRLHAWNLRPPADATRELIKAAAGGDGDRVAALVDPKAQTLQVARTGGKVTGLIVPAYGGPVTVALKTLAPSATADITTPKLVTLNGGSVLVKAHFANGDRLDMRWNLIDGTWKLISLSRTPKSP